MTTSKINSIITELKTITLLEAAELAVRIAGSGTIRVNEPDNNFPSRGQLNTARAYNDFRFRPEVDITQGFDEYYAWLKDTVHRT